MAKDLEFLRLVANLLAEAVASIREQISEREGLRAENEVLRRQLKMGLKRTAGGAMPKTVLAPYPVVTDELDARHWWSNTHNARRMALEYSKYLVILAREAVLSLGPKDEGRPADPEKAT